MASATAGARAAVAAVPTASAVLVVGLVGLVAERAAMLAVPRRRSAPAARPPDRAERPGPAPNGPGPNGPTRPSSAERAEGRLDRGDGIAGLRSSRSAIPERRSLGAVRT